MADTNGNNKLNIAQWVQITTAVLTMLASFGLWLVHSASTPSLEVQEIRNQLIELNKEMVTIQLENERFKYEIESLEHTRDQERAK